MTRDDDPIRPIATTDGQRRGSRAMYAGDGIDLTDVVAMIWTFQKGGPSNLADMM
jgi:hypothetical protein